MTVVMVLVVILALMGLSYLIGRAVEHAEAEAWREKAQALDAVRFVMIEDLFNPDRSENFWWN